MTTLLNPNGPIATVTDLNAAIDLASHQTGGAYEIDLAAGAQIVLARGSTPIALQTINLQPGVSLSIVGNGATIDGSGPFGVGLSNQRGFFVYSGDVTFSDLTIANTVAIGSSSSFGGGGGAGLGGGLFVAADTANGAAPGHVTLDNVTFVNNGAMGGAGNGNGSGGGGGLGNVGSFGSQAAPSDPSLPPELGLGGGLVSLPAPSNGTGGTTTDPGIGGGIGGQTSPNGMAGGAGGFGGGGGGGEISTVYGAYGNTGGAGGFGGGGGGAGYNVYGTPAYGGAGGFGGGGGAGRGTTDPAQSGGAGGFGGGDGRDYAGGGLGAGGAVFVQEGATLVVTGGTLGQGYVGGGAGAGTSGAFGRGIFIQGDTAITLAAAAGETTTVAGTIADQTGSGGTGANAGSGSLHVEGPGTVVLSAANTFTGGIQLNQATLDLTLNASAGSGAITFASPTGIETLRIDENISQGSYNFVNYTFANTIANLGVGDVIDLTALAFRPGTTATFANGALTVNNGQATESFTLASPAITSFTVQQDAGYGTKVVAGAAPTISGLTQAASVNPGDASYRPFAGVLIDDRLASAPTVSVTISINDIAYRTGGLSDGAGFSGLSARSFNATTGYSTYTLTGTASSLSAELNALTFNAGAGTYARTNAITFNLEADTSVSTLTATATATVNIAPVTLASNVSTAATLSADILAISRESQTNGGNGTHYEINLAAGARLTETADLNAINLRGSDTLTINGNGATLDGADAYRGIFAYSGTVAINDLTITHAQARGGAGGGTSFGGNAGGGGAGLGGGCSLPPTRM